jgi:hypothetical protein
MHDQWPTIPVKNDLRVAESLFSMRVLCHDVRGFAKRHPQKKLSAVYVQRFAEAVDSPLAFHRHP